ncbi:MAG TPA: cupin domain-containing protein [Candidatus Paceibacterota bacterium]|nr:cupin domain-containing protein [Candidatus Paceibacterota bacterium]
MKGYIANIEKLTLENEDFRKVLYTAKNCQLVLMCISPEEEIGEEIHDVDQFFRIENGTGTAIINGVTHEIMDGSSVIVPAGATHNIINTGVTPLKLYTIYTPPHHKDGIIHRTKLEAESADEHFDGVTTE